jgi:hypothetical protein
MPATEKDSTEHREYLAKQAKNKLRAEQYGQGSKKPRGLRAQAVDNSVLVTRPMTPITIGHEKKLTYAATTGASTSTAAMRAKDSGETPNTKMGADLNRVYVEPTDEPDDYESGYSCLARPWGGRSVARGHPRNHGNTLEEGEISWSDDALPKAATSDQREAPPNDAVIDILTMRQQALRISESFFTVKASDEPTHLQSPVEMTTEAGKEETGPSPYLWVEDWTTAKAEPNFNESEEITSEPKIFTAEEKPYSHTIIGEIMGPPRLLTPEPIEEDPSWYIKPMHHPFPRRTWEQRALLEEKTKMSLDKTRPEILTNIVDLRRMRNWLRAWYDLPDEAPVDIQKDMPNYIPKEWGYVPLSFMYYMYRRDHNDPTCPPRVWEFQRHRIEFLTNWYKSQPQYKMSGLPMIEPFCIREDFKFYDGMIHSFYKPRINKERRTIPLTGIVEGAYSQEDQYINPFNKDSEPYFIMSDTYEELFITKEEVDQFAPHTDMKLVEEKKGLHYQCRYFEAMKDMYLMNSRSIPAGTIVQPFDRRDTQLRLDKACEKAQRQIEYRLRWHLELKQQGEEPTWVNLLPTTWKAEKYEPDSAITHWQYDLETETFSLIQARALVTTTGHKSEPRPNAKRGYNPDDDLMIIDSGSTYHIERSTEHVSRWVRPNYNPNIRIIGVDQSTSLTVTHIGNIPNVGKVYVVPDSAENLISVRELTRVGHSIAFRDGLVSITRKNGDIVEGQVDSSGLYSVPRRDIYGQRVKAMPAIAEKDYKYTTEQRKRAEEVRNLHNCMNHISDNKLIDCLNFGIIVGTHLTASDVRAYRDIHGPCLACAAGTTIRPHYSTSLNEPAKQIGEVVHVDIYILKEQADNSKYLLLAVDEFSGYMTVRQLKRKTKEQLQESFFSLRGTYKKYNHKLLNIQSDHETNLWSCKDYLANKGIRLMQVTPYQHAQKLERYVRSVNTKMRIMMAALPYVLPPHLYSELLRAIVYGMGDQPTAMFPTGSPRIHFEGRRVELSKRQLIPFGQYVNIRMPSKEGDKYSPRRLPGIALGPANERTYGSMRCYLFATKSVLIRDDMQVLAERPPDFPWSFNKPQLDMGEVVMREQRPTPMGEESQFPSDFRQFPEEIAEAASSESEHDSDTSGDGSKEDESGIYDTDDSLSQRDLCHSRQSQRTLRSQEPLRNRKGASVPTPQDENKAHSKSRHTRAKIKQRTAESPHQQRVNRSNQNNDERPHREARRSWKDGPARMASLFAKTYRLSISEALRGEHSQETIEAITDEILNMLTYKVGHYIKKSSIPYDKIRNIIHAFMFVKHKTTPDGSYDKTKARMVANGANQSKHMYDLLYAATVTLSSVLLLLNIASRDSALLVSYDVKGAFLHAKFGPEDEVHYLRIPRNITELWVKQDPSALPFVDEKGELTLQLDRFLYGLKQSPHKFQMHLKATLTAAGYKQQALDEGLYIKWSGTKYSILSTHVDDILQVTTCPKMRDELHKILNKTYGEVAYHPDANSYIGLTIERSKNGKTFKLSQKGLAEKLIEKYLKPNDTATVTSPASDTLFRVELSVTADKVDQGQYLSLIMSLMYLARLTRPDILMPVTYLASRSHVATQEEWKAGVRIVRYLKGTLTLGVIINCTSLDLHLVCDAAYGYHSDNKGHTGYVITLGKNQSFLAVKSNKQKLVATSSTEAEVYAMCDCVKQAVWIRNIIRDLRISPLAAMTVYQDNKSAIIMTTEMSGFRNSKHILTKISYLRELHQLKALDVEYLDTKSMWADMFTKALHGEAFLKHRAHVMGELADYEDTQA